jgi:hypothetical protein
MRASNRADLKLPEYLYDVLFYYFGACPFGQSSTTGHGDTAGHCQFGSSAYVYRSSRRSVTMRCHYCGLLWTMTFHQMAKVARLRAEDYEQRTGDYADYHQQQAALLRAFEMWAERLDERRGRHTQPPR